MSTKPGAATRREFLCSLGVAGCAAVALPALQGCETAEVYGTTVSGRFDFDVTKAPYQPLAQPGGMVAADFGGKPIVLIRVDGTQLVALNRICTHEACDLEPDMCGTWHKDTKQLECLRHGSQFKPDGTVAIGPATSALTSYLVTFDTATGKGTVQT